MSYADLIIVLDEHGDIVQKGSWDYISKTGSYAQIREAQMTATTSRAQLELTDETLHELGLPNEDEALSVDRPTGDLKIYEYYARIAGRWTMLLYLFACAVFVFGISFPRKFFSSKLGPKYT